MSRRTSSTPGEINPYLWRLSGALLLLLTARPVHADLTPETLAENVRKAIKDKSVELQEPNIRILGKTLGYVTLGGMRRSAEEYLADENYDEKNDMHWYPAKPLAVPLDTQFRIEALRAFIQKDKQKTFTKADVEELRKIVRDELALLNKPPKDEKELMDKLCALDRQAHRRLVAALKARARREKRTFVGPVFEGPKQYTIEIKDVPRGGTVGYLRLVEYEEHKAGNADLNKPQTWWSARETIELPFGRYYFCAFLPDGKTVQKMIEVKGGKGTLSVSFR